MYIDGKMDLTQVERFEALSQNAIILACYEKLKIAAKDGCTNSLKTLEKFPPALQAMMDQHAERVASVVRKI